MGVYNIQEEEGGEIYFWLKFMFVLLSFGYTHWRHHTKACLGFLETRGRTEVNAEIPIRKKMSFEMSIWESSNALNQIYLPSSRDFLFLPDFVMTQSGKMVSVPNENFTRTNLT